MDNLSNIKRISSRIIIADFVGNPKSTVISCYSPTNSSSDDINDFYNGLRSVMENVPPHNFLTIPGDFNAKLGLDDTKFTIFHTKTNRNGELLVDFMGEFNLFPANTKFTKSEKKLWTFEYPMVQGPN